MTFHIWGCPSFPAWWCRGWNRHSEITDRESTDTPLCFSTVQTLVCPAYPARPWWCRSRRWSSSSCSFPPRASPILSEAVLEVSSLESTMFKLLKVINKNFLSNHQMSVDLTFQLMGQLKVIVTVTFLTQGPRKLNSIPLSWVTPQLKEWYYSTQYNSHVSSPEVKNGFCKPISFPIIMAFFSLPRLLVRCCRRGSARSATIRWVFGVSDPLIT